MRKDSSRPWVFLGSCNTLTEKKTNAFGLHVIVGIDAQIVIGNAGRNLARSEKGISSLALVCFT